VPQIVTTMTNKHYPANLKELLDKAREEAYQLTTWDMLTTMFWEGIPDGQSQKARMARIVFMLDRIINEVNEPGNNLYALLEETKLSMEESDELTGTQR
jgi:hypothetical protein